MKILFIINPGSGNTKNNWNSLLEEYFKGSIHRIELFYLPKNCSTESIKWKINEFEPERVIAVGGDGPVQLARFSVPEGTPLSLYEERPA